MNLSSILLSSHPFLTFTHSPPVAGGRTSHHPHAHISLSAAHTPLLARGTTSQYSHAYLTVRDTHTPLLARGTTTQYSRAHLTVRDTHLPTLHSDSSFDWDEGYDVFIIWDCENGSLTTIDQCKMLAHNLIQIAHNYEIIQHIIGWMSVHPPEYIQLISTNSDFLEILETAKKMGYCLSAIGVGWKTSNPIPKIVDDFYTFKELSEY